MGLLLGNRFLPMFGASGETTPIPMTIPDLWAWWDIATLSTLFQNSAGSTPVTGNGDPIAYIADRSGNGRYVRQTGAAGMRPVYTTGAQNGLPAAAYDGGDYLDSVATLSSFPLTVIGVVRTSGTVGATRGILSTWSGTGNILRYPSTNVLQATITSPSTSKDSVATVGANTTTVVGGRFNTTELATVLNGVIATGSHAATVTTSLFVGLGRNANNSATSVFSGHICEMCVYNRALTDLEIATLSTYLNSKWSVY
jgi:hypothetical protein